MKLPAYQHLRPSHLEPELIAGFGDARLVRFLNGRYEVHGGTAADLEDAQLWCSIFMKGRVIEWPAGNAPKTTETTLHEA